MHFPLIIIPGPANCDNHFWNKIFITYIVYSIWNYGLYIVSKHVFLWENVCRSYQMWLMTHQSQIQLVLKIKILKRVYRISYPLKFYRRQRVCFWCCIWEASLCPSNWVYLNLNYPSWFCIFFLKSLLLAPLSIWYWFWLACIEHVQIYHQISGWLLRQIIDEYNIHLEASPIL